MGLCGGGGGSGFNKPQYITPDLNQARQEQETGMIKGIQSLEKAGFGDQVGLASGQGNVYQRTQGLMDAYDTNQYAQPLTESYYKSLTGDPSYQPLGITESRDQGLGGLLSQQFQRAQEDAELGGRLSDAQRAEIARSSLTGAGATGITGRAMGDITSRDLGLSSILMDQQRQDRAAQLGQVQQGIMEGQRGYLTDLDRFNVGMRRQQTQDLQSGLGFMQQLGMQPLQLGYQGAQSLEVPVVGSSQYLQNIAGQNQFNADLAAAEAQAKATKSAGKSSMIGSAIGGGATIGAALI